MKGDSNGADEVSLPRTTLVQKRNFDFIDLTSDHDDDESFNTAKDLVSPSRKRSRSSSESTQDSSNYGRQPSARESGE